jgi:hypothetical protein
MNVTARVSLGPLAADTRADLERTEGIISARLDASGGPFLALPAMQRWIAEAEPETVEEPAVLGAGQPVASPARR